MGTKADVKDWRIGARVKPKYASDTWHGHVGTVVAVYPSGFGGLVDPDGILQIEIGDCPNVAVFRKADDWMTA
jgi:hypothetical protein